MELKRMLTPRDSESVLDRLDRLEREATAGPWETKRWPHRSTEVIGPADPDRYGYRLLVTPKEAAEFAALSRNHLRALLDVVRAAERYPFDAFSLDKLHLALAPLTTPSEQKEETT